MEIVGKGFLANSAKPLAGSHEDSVLFVSGVSSAQEVSESEFAREASLLYGLLRRCRHSGRRLVYFSTSSIGMYGMLSMQGRENGPVYPRSPYGRHKLAMESVIKASGADHLILRLATPVGPHQRAHQFLPAMIGQIREGAVRVLNGARRDLIDADHVVAILDALLARADRHEVVNVASGVAVPIEEIVCHLESRLGVEAAKQYVDVPSERAVSIEKLCDLVPEVTTEMGFGRPDYYRTVIDHYCAATLGLLDAVR